MVKLFHVEQFPGSGGLIPVCGKAEAELTGSKCSPWNIFVSLDLLALAGSGPFLSFRPLYPFRLFKIVPRGTLLTGRGVSTGFDQER